MVIGFYPSAALGRRKTTVNKADHGPTVVELVLWWKRHRIDHLKYDTM